MNPEIEQKPIRAEILDSALFTLGPVFGPMIIQVLLDLDPSPSRGQLVSALKRLMAQVPLLGSQIRSGFWRDQWVAMKNLEFESLVEMVELERENSGKTFEELSFPAFAKRAADKIDPSTEAPIRLILFRQGSRGLLVMRVHHSVADGNGCLQLAMLLGENLNLPPDSPLPEPLDNQRGFFQLLSAFRGKAIFLIIMETIKEMLRPLSLPWFKPLREQETESNGPARGLLARLEIKGAEYQDLQSLAHHLGLTINDLLLTALCRLEKEFYDQRSEPSRYLAVAFTVNLRKFLKDEAIQITNLSGISSLVVKTEKIKGFNNTAGLVRDTAGELKRKYPGLGFMMAPLAVFGAFPIAIIKIAAQRYFKYLKLLQARGVILTNIGIMDPYLEPFGNRVKKASVIGPFVEGPFPVFTATGQGPSLTIYLTQLTRNPASENLCGLMAERLKYCLLEWPKE